MSTPMKVGAVFVAIFATVVLMEVSPKFGGALLFILVFALLARGFQAGTLK